MTVGHQGALQKYIFILFLIYFRSLNTHSLNTPVIFLYCALLRALGPNSRGLLKVNVERLGLDCD